MIPAKKSIYLNEINPFYWIELGFYLVFIIIQKH